MKLLVTSLKSPFHCDVEYFAGFSFPFHSLQIQRVTPKNEFIDTYFATQRETGN